MEAFEIRDEEVVCNRIGARGRVTEEVIQNFCGIGHLQSIEKQSALDTALQLDKAYLGDPFRRNKGSCLDIPHTGLREPADQLYLRLNGY